MRRKTIINQSETESRDNYTTRGTKVMDQRNILSTCVNKSVIIFNGVGNVGLSAILKAKRQREE